MLGTQGSAAATTSGGAALTSTQAVGAEAMQMVSWTLQDDEAWSVTAAFSDVWLEGSSNLGQEIQCVRPRRWRKASEIRVGRIGRISMLLAIPLLVKSGGEAIS